MEKFTLENISLVIGVIVILVGLWGLLTQKNLLKMVIGFSLFDTGIHVVMVSIGYIRNRTAPILDGTVSAGNAANSIVDPIPQALVLTAIVIGLGVTALMLSYVLRMYQKKKTLEINQYNDLKW
ncbi:MAG TPA: NADH-quinone oxidoreductase subunit K [Bacteroidales bacterium]|nr:NADH-quinone oxidoreductase subunit K [Bacteroidales bacterium]